jgi:hypothetical protein
MENKSFVGFASIGIIDGLRWRLKKNKIASTFTAEALAIGESLYIMRKIDSEQNFMIFPDWESVLKGVSNTSTMFSGSLGTVELKLMRELARRQSNQSKIAQTVKSYYRWQILKPSGKSRQGLHRFCRNAKEREEIAARMAPLCGSMR